MPNPGHEYTPVPNEPFDEMKEKVSIIVYNLQITRDSEEAEEKILSLIQSLTMLHEGRVCEECKKPFCLLIDEFPYRCNSGEKQPQFCHGHKCQCRGFFHCSKCGCDKACECPKGEDWEDVFNKLFVITPYHGFEELDPSVSVSLLRAFIKEHIDLAHLSGIRIGEAYKGEAKMKAYQEGYEEGRTKVFRMCLDAVREAGATKDPWGNAIDDLLALARQEGVDIEGEK